MIRASHQKGFTLIETLIYVSILVVVAVFVVNALLSLADVSRHLAVSQSLNRSASLSLERMVRDIREAKNINLAESTFNTSPGTLEVVVPDGAGEKTVHFSVSNGGALAVSEDGAFVGNTTRGSTEVTNLIFRQASNGTSTVIKIEMSLESVFKDVTKSASFYGSAVVRGSYY